MTRLRRSAAKGGAAGPVAQDFEDPRRFAFIRTERRHLDHIPIIRSTSFPDNTAIAGDVLGYDCTMPGIIGGMKMIELAHALKLMRGTIPFALAGLAVIALSGAGPAAAQHGDQTNTGLGQGALSSITTGTDDTALGFDALKSNTSGRGNTATGANSLLQNTIGNNNTA